MSASEMGEGEVVQRGGAGSARVSVQQRGGVRVGLGPLFRLAWAPSPPLPARCLVICPQE